MTTTTPDWPMDVRLTFTFTEITADESREMETK